MKSIPWYLRLRRRALESRGFYVDLRDNELRCVYCTPESDGWDYRHELGCRHRRFINAVLKGTPNVMELEYRLEITITGYIARRRSRIIKACLPLWPVYTRDFRDVRPVVEGAPMLAMRASAIGKLYLQDINTVEEREIGLADKLNAAVERANTAECVVEVKMYRLFEAPLRTYLFAPENWAYPGHPGLRVAAKA